MLYQSYLVKQILSFLAHFLILVLLNNFRWLIFIKIVFEFFVNFPLIPANFQGFFILLLIDRIFPLKLVIKTQSEFNSLLIIGQLSCYKLVAYIYFVPMLFDNVGVKLVVKEFGVINL